MIDAGSALRAAVGDRLREGVPLLPMTTFKVGGVAEFCVDTASADEVRRAIFAARDAGLAVTVLGGGSNVLVADAGVRGLVIRMRGGSIAAADNHGVTAEAGVTINGLVRWTLARGLAGLEAWAGTPGQWAAQYSETRTSGGATSASW